jgi:hypothetical protein
MWRKSERDCLSVKSKKLVDKKYISILGKTNREIFISEVEISPNKGQQLILF